MSKLTPAERARCADRLVLSVVDAQVTLREAIEALDRSGFGAVLFLGPEGTVEAIVTDGDVRRAVLKSVSLDTRARDIANGAPMTGSVELSRGELLQSLRSRGYPVSQLPLVDDSGRLVGLLLRSDLEATDTLRAVIMAGGFGTRLGALTRETPKPMLPVGDRPLLEHIVAQLRVAGIKQMSLTTHFRGDVIRSHFGDGSSFGVEIGYLDEQRPLGTAGALGLLGPVDEPVLVMNGDILTRLDVREMLRFHREHRADVTVAVRRHDMQVPFGVVETDGARITGLREKPTVSHLVSAGIYLLEPSSIAHVVKDEHIDMPELITRLVDHGRMVVSFPVTEYWLDVGRPDDYAKAQVDVVDLNTEQPKR